MRPSEAATIDCLVKPVCVLGQLSGLPLAFDVHSIYISNTFNSSPYINSLEGTDSIAHNANAYMRYAYEYSECYDQHFNSGYMCLYAYRQISNAYYYTYVCMCVEAC